MQPEEAPLDAANDAFLARLEQPNAYEEWEVEVEPVPGLFVNVIFAPKTNVEPAEGLANARRAYLAIRADIDRGKRAAAEHLLELYNDEWSDEDEPIEADAFMRRMRLESIVLKADGSAEIHYEDGGMFLGHIIVVSLNAEGETQDATIAG